MLKRLNARSFIFSMEYLDLQAHLEIDVYKALKRHIR